MTTVADDEVDVVLLAGGRGSRLGEITRERPKPLVAVAGRSLLYRNLDQFVRFGLQRLVIVVGYRSKDMRTALETYDWRGSMPDLVVVEQSSSGAEGAMLDGLAACAGPRALVRCADDLMDDQVTSAILQNRGIGAILTRPIRDSPLLRLRVENEVVRGTSRSENDPIMTYNLCLQTSFAREWVAEAVRANLALVDLIDPRFADGKLFAVDGAETASINRPDDIRAAENWVLRREPRLR